MDRTPNCVVSVGAGTIVSLIGALLVGGICGAQPAWAATFYVRTTGSDANNGLTPATAFQTIRHAAEILNNAGDHVVVGPGTYHEGDISPHHNGIQNRPVVFSADSTGVLTGDAPGTVTIMPPPEQMTGFIIMGRHDIVIEGFTIVGAIDAGIQVRADRVKGISSQSISIINNVVRDSVKRGIDVSIDGSAEIQGNTTSHNGSSGITVQGESGSSPTVDVSNNTVTTSGSRDTTAVGDCNNDGVVTIEELLLGVNIALGTRPVSDCLAMDANADAEVTIVELLGAIEAALGSGGSPGGGADATSVGGPGVFLTGITKGAVQNNVVCSNSGDGITVRGASNVQIANNLIYANGRHGVAVGTGGAADAVSDASVVNNTVYNNAGWGLALGNLFVASPGTLVVNNIFNLNGTGGVAAQELSFAARYVAGFNLNTDGYGPGTRPSVYEFSAAPAFVNPAGADGVLGEDGYADDDFRLQNATNPAQRSAAIDAGSGPTSSVGITGTSVPNTQIDAGKVDLGYHYNALASQKITVAVPDLFMPIYVRAQGSPDNDGLSPATALDSIYAAGLLATSSTTVIVGPGRYNEGDIRVREGARDVVFLADPTGAATGDLPGPVLVDATDTGRDTGFVLVDGPGAVIDGFHVTGGTAAGIQVRVGSDGAQVRNNVVFSNQRSGVEALDANDVEIQNNLVYANGGGGIRVAQGDNPTVLNNTSYGNGADGILVGGGVGLTPTRGATVMRNIVQGNQKGILVTENAFEGYTTAFNVALDGFAGHTPRADSDFIADALFVNPPGPDGLLGGAGFADDDFHLVQDATVTSPAVDIDFQNLDTLTNGSTRSDGLPDTGPADAGYHYPLNVP